MVNSDQSASPPSVNTEKRQILNPALAIQVHLAVGPLQPLSIEVRKTMGSATPNRANVGKKAMRDAGYVAPASFLPESIRHYVRLGVGASGFGARAGNTGHYSTPKPF